MTYTTIALEPQTDLEHFVAFAGLYEMLIDNFIDHETVGKQIKEGKEEAKKRFNKLGMEPPITSFVVYEDHKPVGYGQLQPHYDEEKERFESHSYAFIFTLSNASALQKYIHEKLLFYARQLPGHEVIFYFVESEDEINEYLSWGGDLVEKGYTYELSIFDAEIPTIEYFSKKTDFEVETLEEPDREKIGEFLEVYNLSKAEEPKGDSTRPVEPKTLDELMEIFSGKQYDNIVTLGRYKGEPAAISHFGLTEFQNFVYQRHTGVHPKFWRQGLGTAIKANALLWVMDHHPEYTHITTEVLDENKAMISINKKLGFEVKKLQATIEFEL